MKKIIKFNILLFFLISIFVIRMPFTFAAGDYYATADTTSGNNLVISLSKIINSNTVDVGYAGLWDAYKTTDCRPGTTIVWDMYSNEEYDVVTGHSGSYSQEGDMYNREHSVPQSWFGERSPMKADLFHVYPTDGKVNGMRSNYVYGETDSPTYTSKNGSKLGASSFSGYSGTVFEPIDEYKGDFARTYFYMATRYYSQLDTWTAGEAQKVFQGSYPYLTDYAVNLFMKWNDLDPVSEKEINRNDAVYSIQKNRNPYIDHPEWISLAFLNESSETQKTEVEKVIEAIQALPTYVTLSDEAKVLEIQNAYNALSAAEQNQVTNADVLNLAVSTIQSLHDFTNVQTKASLKIISDGQFNPVDVDMRFGGIVPISAYHSDASYGVLVTANTTLELEQFYENQSITDFRNSNPEFKSILCSPAKVSQNASGDYVVDVNGDAYQYAWVITDMEGHYSEVLKAYIYMEYNGSLYIGLARSYSVEELARYYYVNRVALGLSENEINMIKKLIPDSQFGEECPGDVLKDYWG